MATFKAQVDAITGMVSGTTEGALTDNELKQVISDGVMEVTDKYLQSKPADIGMFQVESAESTSQGGHTVKSRLIAVVRETGTDNDWRECRQTSIGMQSKVTDPESMDYASKFNPVYHIDDNNTINVYPEPAGSNNAYKVYYVNDAPQNDSGTAIDEAHSTIKYFPKFLVSMVVKYASIKSIEAKLGSLTIDEEDETLVASYRVLHKELKDEYDAYFNEVTAAEKAKNEKLQQLMGQMGQAK